MSERALHQGWLDRVLRHAGTLPAGWYLPPPNGFSVLLGEPPDYDRCNFTSLRSESKWPTDSNICNDDSLMFVYASPVSKTTAMIGDFQATLYRGGDTGLRDYIASCFSATAAIVRSVRVGIELRELYCRSAEILAEFGLSNDARSTIDRSGATNIGHTIPWSDGQYDPAIWKLLEHGSSEEIAHTISNARIFITEQEHYRIGDTVAFTVEPQLRAIGYPLVSFHITVCIENGIKRVHTSFLPLFEMYGMLKYLSPSDVSLVTADD